MADQRADQRTVRPRYVLSIDQGTTSTRCMIFDHAGGLRALRQREHHQFFPQPGWSEHDAKEIWRNVERIVPAAMKEAGITAADVVGIGIANQRETLVVWERATGEPVHRAIVWQDIRTAELIQQWQADPRAGRVRELTGLPIASYFAAPRLHWLLAERPELRERAERGELLAGTIDSWLVWNLTGGVDGGRHITDVTNASRTLLMDLRTRQWHPELLELFEIPAAVLPEIVPSLDAHGLARTVVPGAPITALLGDQQSALFGQACFSAGEVKCTYGTGGFLLMNTGDKLVDSEHGLIPTVAYTTGSGEHGYALEGSIAVTGSLVQWFRDGLGIISTAPEIETLALTVADSGGSFIVPAFSGLLAPHWRDEARGVIVGLTSYVTKAHLARAVLEATGWQTREVIDAMRADTGYPIPALRVDGGMTSNNLLMQFVADVSDAVVARPLVGETVCVGAAYAAGLSAGFWPDFDALRRNWHRAAQWSPVMPAEAREREYRNWRRAV
ncbi:MAG: glycerol kinase, partial [Frankiales bacterium]|nr:glycerol kinase [Frankiales bacterium]